MKTSVDKQNELVDEINSYDKNALFDCMDFYKVQGVRQLTNKQLEKYLDKLKYEQK